AKQSLTRTWMKWCSIAQCKLRHLRSCLHSRSVSCLRQCSCCREWRVICSCRWRKPSCLPCWLPTCSREPSFQPWLSIYFATRRLVTKLTARAEIRSSDFNDVSRRDSKNSAEAITDCLKLVFITGGLSWQFSSHPVSDL